MTEWNPNDPSVVGPEFLGVSDASLQVYGLGAPVVQRFRSNAAETVASVGIHQGVQFIGQPSLYLLEIVAPGDEIMDPADFETNDYAPNVLTVVAGTVTHINAIPPPAVADIDEWPPSYSNAVWMGPNASFDLQFATAGINPTGRIAAVAVEVVTAWGDSSEGTGYDPTRRTVVSLVNGGTLYGTQTKIIPSNNAARTAGRAIFSWGEINPVTGEPWTEADVEAFDTATTQVRIARQAADGGTWKTPAIRMIVTYENAERRLARGVLSTPAAASAAWSAAIPLAAPDGTPNWSKSNATDYALVIRQADQGGVTPFDGNWLTLSTIQAAPGESAPADLLSYDVASSNVTFISDEGVNLLGQLPITATEKVGRLLPFILTTTAPATSADGQPYTQVATVGVYTGSGTTQGELTPGGTDDYAGLRLTAGYFTGVPTADLTVEVRRRSDSVLMGTFTVTPADLVAAGAATAGSLVLVQVKATAPGIALASGVQYYLDLSSSTPVANAWLVGLLAVVGGAGGITYQEATYQGGTDQADPINGAASTTLPTCPADFAAVIDAAVDTPADFTASAEVAPLPDEQPCELDGIPYVQLGWTVTSLGADFASYQIERLGEDGTTWQQIAGITDESVDGFVDYEGRLGVAETYRLRVVRTDGASSYWSSELTVTADAAGCGYTFTSNEAPEYAVGYPDTYKGTPTRTYQFPEAQEVQFRTMFGRDYQIAFRPIARRGVTFDRHLVIGGLAAPAAGVGPPAADMLRDIAWATLSYVCVRDQSGNRWFANLRVVDLEVTNYGTVYIHEVNVGVVQLTGTPSVVDAAS